MRIVSPVLKKVVYPALSRTGVLRHTSPRGLAVVTYHGVLPPGYKSTDAAFDGNLVSAGALRDQIRLLKAHYAVISPDDFLAWIENRKELPRRAVLLTCDDGLLNCVTDMLPVLLEENVRCLFFVTGVSVEESRRMLWYEELFLLFMAAPAGAFAISNAEISVSGEMRLRDDRRKIWWNAVQKLSAFDAGTRESFLAVASTQFGFNRLRPYDDDVPSCRRFGLLTREELRKLDASGMTIGAHTLSHPILSCQPVERAHVEIVGCRARLEDVLQKPVWAFAYPFGDSRSVDAQVVETAKQAGYKAAFMNFGGGMGTKLPTHYFPRIHVTAEMDLAEFEAHVSGLYARLHDAF